MNRQWQMLFTAFFLLASQHSKGWAQNNAERAKSFAKEKTHASKRAYLRSLGRQFVDVEPNALSFFDNNGRLLKRVSLHRDSAGYARRPVVTEEGAVIIKSTTGYESAGFSFEFYSADGRRTAEVPAFTGGGAISPKGNIAIVAHPNGPYHFSGAFSIYNAFGSKVADFSVPELSASPGVVFSRDSKYSAILADGFRTVPRSRNRVLIVTEAGAVLGKYETNEWTVQAPDLEGHGPTNSHRLARLDVVSKTVVIEGFDTTTLHRITFAINFGGNFLWRRDHHADTTSCPTTMIIKPASKRLVIADFCDQTMVVAELDIRTGEAAQDRQIPIASGQAIRATMSIPPNESGLLINLTQKGTAGEKQTAFLLDSNLQVAWKESFSRTGDGAHFDSEGRVTISRGGEIQVGKFRE